MKPKAEKFRNKLITSVLQKEKFKIRARIYLNF